MNTTRTVRIEPGTHVIFSDRQDPGATKTGIVIEPRRRKAWTPSDYSFTAPDHGMVMVAWEGEYERYWEYTNTLTTQPNAGPVA